MSTRVKLSLGLKSAGFGLFREEGRGGSDMKGFSFHFSVVDIFPLAQFVVEATHHSRCLCVSVVCWWWYVCGVIVLPHVVCSMLTETGRCARSRFESSSSLLLQFQEFFVHLRQSMMADANTTFECQVQFPELRAMRTQQSNLLSKSLEMRGLLDALCKVLIDAGVVSEQRLLAEAHRQSFAAVRRSHPCGWGLSLWRTFQSREVAYNVASCFVNKRDCVGLRTASKAFATCTAEVSSAWVRPKVLVWGGDGLAQDSVEIFDPVFNTWETSPSAQEFREEAASAVINGRLYVCGGEQNNPGPPSTSLDCFDPVLGIWQALPPMSQGREGHSAAVVGARLCVCGGQGGALRDGRRRTLRSAEVFDTVTNTWQSLPAMVHTRVWAGAAVIRGHVYMVGGDLSESSSERLPPTGNWQELPPMNEARMRFSTAVIADRLYVCGGIGRTSLERFDPEVGVWELLQPMLEARAIGSVAVLHGQLYMCGGGGREHCRQWSALTPRTTRGSSSLPCRRQGLLLALWRLTGGSSFVAALDLT